MIFGMGCDLIEVHRIEKNITNHNFLERVFSPAEIVYCKSYKNASERFAARFAAKEAFLKAWGTGLSGNFNLNEIEILNHESGKPYLNFLALSLKTIQEKGDFIFHVSISHLKDYALATVIIENT